MRASKMIYKLSNSYNMMNGLKDIDTSQPIPNFKINHSTKKFHMDEKFKRKGVSSLQVADYELNKHKKKF